MNIAGAVITLVIILFSMVLHELSHGAVAYLLGDTTAKDDGRLTLNKTSRSVYVCVVADDALFYECAGVWWGKASAGERT